MNLTKRDYIEGDYQTHIQSLVKENMEQLFVDNFGGWSDKVSEKKFFKILDEGFVQLFFLDEIFVGYVSFGVEKDNLQSCLLHDIHIVKEFQGEGYGSKILDFVEEKTQELGLSQIKVFVFESNPAITFYSKHQFKEIEHLDKSQTSVLLKKLN